MVDPRLLRSVRIEKDWRTGDPVENYVLGSAATDTLHGILKAAERGPRARAFTVTGPYGTGKSALALFLTDLLAGRPRRRARAAKRYRDASGDGVPTKEFLPILATCRPAPLGEILDEATDGAFKELGIERRVGLSELVDEAGAKGYGGVLLILDELGKALEFAAREPASGDLFILQEIAETAARSEVPLIVVGILHQSFAGYGDGLDAATRNEWEKVQGRYLDLPFLPSEALLAHLVANSIGASPSDREPIDVAARAVCLIPGTWPAAMDEGSFLELCRKSWPLHPLTVAALPVLMRRFGQNERSLFAFLVERGLLVGPSGESEIVRLADLFEHVSDWIGHGRRSHAEARRWRLALEILHSKAGLDEAEQDVLRTIALLAAVERFAPFRATTETISLALPGTDVPGALGRLVERSAVVHRRHLGGWVLWAGSDVDVEGLIEAAHVEVAGRTDVAKALVASGALRPALAQRHYEEGGVLRWFRHVVLTDPDATLLPSPTEDPTNGVLALAFGGSVASQARFEAWAREQTRPDLVVAVVHRAPAFRNLAEELESILLVEKNAPELRGDRVAREELAARRAALSAAMADEAERLLDPTGPEGCVFYYKGERRPVQGARDLARLYSTVCDALFPQAPRLRNELISRRKLSSAAAAAQRTLIDAMLKRGASPRLEPFDGEYPPERAIYESVLLQTGLHRDLGESWGFGAPSEDDPGRLRPIWNYLEERLFANFPAPVSVKELADELARPPFGLVAGPFPLILAAFMLVHAEETALYRGASFLSEPGIEQWELLLRRPEFYAVAGWRQSGARKRALELVCDRLGVRPAGLMPPVRFVVKAVNGLPSRASSTKDVSLEAARVRAVVKEATSPERFFFYDLPVALGLPPLGEEPDEAAAQAFYERLRNVLRELDGVVERTRRWARAELARAAGFPPDDAGFAVLRAAASSLRDRMADPKARDLCDRLLAADAEAAEIGALSLVLMRPVEVWTDADRDAFPVRAAALARELRGEVQRGGAVPDREAEDRAEAVASTILQELRIRQNADASTLLAALKRLVKRMEVETNP